MAIARRNRFYAVKSGRRIGVFHCWEDCKEQVKDYVGARFKIFHTREDAEDYIRDAIPVAIASTSTSVEEAVTVKDESQSSRPSSQNTDRRSDVEEGGWCDAEDQDVPTEVEDNSPSQVPYPLAPRPSPPKSRKGKERETDHIATSSTSRCDDLVVYCDGACKGNGKEGSVAGIGVWWAHDDKRNMCKRCPGVQTNNCAELYAIVCVLEKTSIDPKRKLVIKTDSDYSINCLTTWILNWTKSGTSFRKKNGRVVVNSELISYAKALIECREMLGQKVELVHVRGHVGVPGNEAADRLANRGAALKPRKPRDWVVKEQRYREGAEATRMELASGNNYLRRDGSMRIDVIGTSQEERELGGFQIVRKRRGPSETSASASASKDDDNDESESSSSEYSTPVGTQEEFPVLRPVGSPQRYKSDQSTASESPNASPPSKRTEQPTEEARRRGEEIARLLRAKRAGKPSNPPEARTIASAQKPVRAKASAVEGFELGAYAKCLADGDLLAEDLSD
ncbi:hypothetical protein V5O48_011974 [Marasmius crinis-equi]|uniref:ribonuclease H n=1 Tax=Marasmius crinis-equi TaxID=585013 RepID=A0ABR3F4J2_9AGAR